MKVKLFLAAGLIACMCLSACSSDMESSGSNPLQSGQSSYSQDDFPRKARTHFLPQKVKKI